MSDPYKILGVPYTATDAEIKKAYHALARRYHPDSFAGDEVRLEMANRKMRDINAAYEQIVKDRESGVEPREYAAPTAQRATPKREGEEKAEEKTKKQERAERREEKARAERAREELYRNLRTMIGGESYAVALSELARIPIPERGGEWHYLAGLCHLGLRHLHDAFREVNEACRLDRKNAEYKKTREEMKKTAAGFDRAAGRGVRRASDIRIEGKPPKKDGFLKRSFLRAIGMEDGKC